MKTSSLMAATLLLAVAPSALSDISYAQRIQVEAAGGMCEGSSIESPYACQMLFTRYVLKVFTMEDPGVLDEFVIRIRFAAHQ